MPNCLIPEFRFSDVCVGADVPAKWLRNQMQRENIVTVHPVPEQGWQEFCLADIIATAVAYKLTGFGLPIGAAFNVAWKILIEIQGKDWLDKYDAELFPDFWINRGVLIWGDGSSSYQIKLHTFKDQLPSDISQAFLVLSMQALVSGVYSRIDDTKKREEEPAANFFSALKKLEQTIRKSTS